LVRRTAAFLALLIAVVVVPGTPASAHTVSGAGATNFKTTLVSVAPAEPGLRMRVVENGSRLELSNTSSVEITVLGYQGEPYLRVGPQGVFENRRSPATYLNRTRQGGALGPDADYKAVPVWQKTSDGHTALWHDHRIHWMLPQPPLPVRQRPAVQRLVFTWTVALVRAGQPVTVTGTLSWVPGPSALPWLALAGVLLVGTLAGCASRRWGAALAVALVALIAVDAVHATGVAFDFAGSLPRHLLLIVGASYYSIIAWALGLFGLRMLARRNVDGIFVSLFCGLVIVVFGGLADFRVLDRSQAPFAFPVSTERALIAASLGLGLGLVIGSVWAFRRNNVPVERPTV
jgi:hypothetical protein